MNPTSTSRETSQWNEESTGASGMASKAMDKISGAAGAVAGQVQEQASGLAESARGMVSQAGEKLLNTAEEQKTVGADFVSGMAGAVRRAAGEFDTEIPQAATYIRQAADQLDNVSEMFRRRDVSQLVTDVQDFARRQPTAFLGVAVLAGFAAVRFLKSSGGNTASAGMSSSPHPSYRGYGTTSTPGVSAEDWSSR